MKGISLSYVKELVENNLFYALLITYFISIVTSIFIFLAKNWYLEEPEEGEDQILIVEEETQEESSGLIVEIAGAVNEPGVYTLRESTRVADLVKKAGGFSKQALETWITRNLNLASLLKDAQKIYIPFKWDENTLVEEKEPHVLTLVNDSLLETPEMSKETTSTSTSNRDGVVNINTATGEELESLPGVGPVYAGKIVAGRPYEDFQDLQQRAGLTESVLAKIDQLINY